MAPLIQELGQDRPRCPASARRLSRVPRGDGQPQMPRWMAAID